MVIQSHIKYPLFTLDNKPVHSGDKLYIKNTDIQFTVYDFEDGMIIDTTFKGTYYINNVSWTPN